jgi:hypothetical protein
MKALVRVDGENDLELYKQEKNGKQRNITC